MNMKDRLNHVSKKSIEYWELSRQAVCEAAVKQHGTVLTSSLEEAMYLTKKYGVKAKWIETNLESVNGPFYFDPWATETLLRKAASKIESLEIDNALLELKVKRLENL